MTGLKRALRSRQGFTLVELIVVLVILGVLGTFTIPALTKYIDSVKESQAVSETQACVQTATRLAAQQYAKAQKIDIENSITSESSSLQNLNGWINPNRNTNTPTVAGDLALTEGTGQYFLHVRSVPSGNLPFTSTDIYTSITGGADVSGQINQLTFNSSGQVLYLVYTSKNGIQVVYTNSGSTSTVDTGSNEAVTVPKPLPPSNPGDSGGNTGGGSGGNPGDSGGTGGSTPDPLAVTIKKINASTQQGLSGAQLQILSGTNVVQEFTSYSTGNTVKLNEGSYTLHEDAAPNGFDLADDIEFTVVKNGTSLSLVAPSGVLDTDGAIVMSDPVKVTTTASEMILHIQDGTTKEPFTARSFQLVCDSTNQNITVTTDSEGNIVLPVVAKNQIPTDTDRYLVEHCSYILQETQAPAGYQALQSCTFSAELRSDWDGTQTIVTGLNLWIHDNFNNETADNDARTITVNRYPVAKLLIRKVTPDGTALPNAAFTLSKGTFTLTSFRSGEDAQAIQVKLHNGDGIEGNVFIDLSGQHNVTLTLKETSAPSGYLSVGRQSLALARAKRSDRNLLDSFDFTVTTDFSSIDNFQYDAASHTLTITDPEKICKVNVYKIRQGSSDLVPGAELTLYDANHKELQSFVTGGNVQILSLKLGSYEIAETKTPNGYLTAVPVAFSITDDTADTLDIKLVDPTLKDENITVTAPVEKANLAYTTTNWSHKLINHDPVSLNKELLLYHGKLYFCKEKYKIANPNREDYKNFFTAETNNQPLPQPVPPNPIEFLEQNGKGYTGDIVELTGRVVMKTDTSNMLQRGDLLVDISKKKAYAYFGSSPLPVKDIVNNDSEMQTQNQLYQVSDISVTPVS